MDIDTAVDQMLDEGLRFWKGKPSPHLEYSRRGKSNIIVAPIDTSGDNYCFDVKDFAKAMKDFTRVTQKFMRARGLQPVGKPFFCGQNFVWKYENDPNRENHMKPNVKVDPSLKNPALDTSKNLRHISRMVYDDHMKRLNKKSWLQKLAGI